MPAYGAAGSAERTVSEKPCFPIAKMQLARREAGRMSQQADHGMTRPLSILKAFAEHHVATAFTMHRARRCKSPQTDLEMKGIRQRAGMKFRIAAREPAGIARVG